MAFPFLLAATALTAGSQFLSAKSNQRSAEAEGSYALSRSALEEDRFRRDTERLRGKMEAVANKAGRPTTTGSVADLLAEQVGEDELDALIIRYGGQLNAWRANVAGKMSARQSILGPLSTLLTAGGAGAFNLGGGTAGNLSGTSSGIGSNYLSNTYGQGNLFTPKFNF